MESKKILIIKFGALGDIVLASVMATAIKQKHPDYRVDFLAGEKHYKILLNHPHLDNVYVWDESDKYFNQLFSQGKNLRKEKYDIVINVTNSLKNVILGAFLAPKKIIGKQKFKKNWVEEYYLLAKKAVNDIELPKNLYVGVDKDCLSKANELLAPYKRPYFVIIPGGATDRLRQGRIWNIENWRALCDELIEKYGATVFVLGSKGERKYHSNLTREGVVLLSGELNIQESSAVISKSDVVISQDTGPMHIASALNVRTIAILGSTSPDKIKPYGARGYCVEPKSECRYCWKKKCPYLKPEQTYTPCMESITPSDVMEVVDNIFSSD